MSRIRMKVRFDFAGKTKSGKRFFGSKSSEETAEEMRQQQITLIRNVPVQGIHIEDIEMNQEIYTIYDEVTSKAVAYAPVSIAFTADSLEDAVRFTMKEEFRTVEIIEPEELVLSRIDMERLLLKISDELLNYKSYLERIIDNWK